MNKSFRKFVVYALCFAGLAGCSRDNSEITQSEWEKLIAIRGEAREAYRREIASNYVDATKTDSLGVQPDSGQTYDDILAELTKDENLKLLQKIEDSYSADSEDERKVRRLRHFLLNSVVQQRKDEVERYLTEMRNISAVVVGDKKLGLGDLQEILANDSDRDLRQRAYYAWIPELEKENAVIESIVEIEDSAAFDLGYGDYTSLCQERQELDYGTLAEQARSTVRQTDSIFTTLAKLAVPELSGLKYEMLRGYDLPYLVGTSPFDEYFQSGDQFERCDQVLKQLGLGFDDTNLPTVARQQSRVNTRAATYAVNIPDDIRVVLPSDSGLWATSALFHEIGHVLHWVNTTEREFEFTQLGGGALKEAYAFLFEGLLDEPEFVSANFGIPVGEVNQYLRQRAFVQLLAVRSYCGDFLFELEVYGGATDPRLAYEQINKPLGAFSWNEVDRELMFRRLDGFASAEYLTGWFLAAQIREYLRDEFGDQWYMSADAGNFLKGLWAHGTRKSELEIAAIFGDSTITPDALVRHLTAISTR